MPSRHEPRALLAAIIQVGYTRASQSNHAASGGNIVNQVQRTFNGLGQLTAEYQSHSGAVNTGSTPKVQYAYTEMSGGANHSRLTSMTYPNGKVLTYNYSSGLNDTISRLSSLSDTSGTLESYDYLGLGTVVRRAHSQPGVDLTYIKQTGESNGDAGDQYIGLDRFGRVVDQRWIKTSTGTATDRFKYGYDRDSNRLYRTNEVNHSFDELYHASGASAGYDGLNQLTDFRRGTLSDANSDGVPDTVSTASRTQAWDFDALGNFDAQNTDGTNQTRSHNKQNEITSISGATTPTYDANGNVTKDETGKQFVYDAWNRLVKVKDSGGTTLETFGVDALSRRVSITANSTTTDLYYSNLWQVLEERVSGNATKQYVWSPGYVDGMILRDRDTDANGSLDERLWAQQDANWNVTALINASGVVQERYAYDPFGNFVVYSASWTVQTGGSNYAWTYQHQGLHYDFTATAYDNRGRWYDPDLGRFMQNDRAGYVAGDPNLYRYVRNSPGRWFDPTGSMIAEVKEVSLIDKKPIPDFAKDIKWQQIHGPVQLDDLGPYPVSGIDADKKLEAVHVLWVVFKGKCLDDLQVFRYDSGTMTSTGRNSAGNFYSVVSSWRKGYKPGAIITADGQPDGPGPHEVKKDDKFVIVADAPGSINAPIDDDPVIGALGGFPPWSFKSNSYVVGKSITDGKIKGEIWYDVVVAEDENYIITSNEAKVTKKNPA
jgi:RHS repeat-associated protein